MNNTLTEIVWDADCEQVAEFCYLLDCRDNVKLDLLEYNVDCYWFYEDAEKEIYRRTFKNKVTYFYPDEDFKVDS